MMEQVKAFNAKPQWEARPNAYGSGWNNNNANHPYESNSQQPKPFNPPPGFQPRSFGYQQPPAQKPTVEQMFEQLMTSNQQMQASHTQFMQSQGHKNAELSNEISQLRAQMATSQKIVETQITQLAQQVGHLSKSQGKLPGNTEINPRANCSAITLRSGKELDGPMLTGSKGTNDKETVVAKEVVPPPTPNDHDEDEKKYTKVPERIYVPPIPFPQRVAQGILEKRYGKFLEILKQLHVSIPFTELISEIPSYAKFLKEILAKKRSVGSIETIVLTEECSSIVLNDLPPKLKDPGSFTIPCMINNCKFDKALCDLGASINLMPLSLFTKLKLGDLKPSKVFLQLADGTTRVPKGVVEDVLVKIDKFTFPVDFIVLDMDENHEVPLILGRPFLATGRSLIDMQQGELILRVQNESVTFKIFDPPAPSPTAFACYTIGATNEFCAKCDKQLVSSENKRETMMKVVRAQVLQDAGEGCTNTFVPGQPCPKEGLFWRAKEKARANGKSVGGVHLATNYCSHDGDPG